MSNAPATPVHQLGLESLSKSFEPAALEAHWGPEWEKRGYGVAGFRGTGTPTAQAPAFAIQLPPPNVTGTLHMGHAFNQTIMDSLTRYHRMSGANTVWVPGTDHAGIATQIVVERQLQAQGISRHDMGPTPAEARKNFVAKVWEWKAESGGTIVRQLRRLGGRGGRRPAAAGRSGVRGAAVRGGSVAGRRPGRRRDPRSVGLTFSGAPAAQIRPAAGLKS